MIDKLLYSQSFNFALLLATRRTKSKGYMHAKCSNELGLAVLSTLSLVLHPLVDHILRIYPRYMVGPFLYTADCAVIQVYIQMDSPSYASS